MDNLHEPYRKLQGNLINSRDGWLLNLRLSYMYKYDIVETRTLDYGRKESNQTVYELQRNRS